MRIIDVWPLRQGGTVRGEQIDNDLVFRSGRTAEQAARQLADRLAKVGMPSEVRIHLRDGTLGGRFFTPASPPAEHPQHAGGVGTGLAAFGAALFRERSEQFFAWGDAASTAWPCIAAGLASWSQPVKQESDCEAYSDGEIGLGPCS